MAIGAITLLLALGTFLLIENPLPKDGAGCKKITLHPEAATTTRRDLRCA